MLYVSCIFGWYAVPLYVGELLLIFNSTWVNAYKGLKVMMISIGLMFLLLE